MIEASSVTSPRGCSGGRTRSIRASASSTSHRQARAFRRSSATSTEWARRRVEESSGSIQANPRPRIGRMLRLGSGVATQISSTTRAPETGRTRGRSSGPVTPAWRAEAPTVSVIEGESSSGRDGLICTPGFHPSREVGPACQVTCCPEADWTRSGVHPGGRSTARERIRPRSTVQVNAASIRGTPSPSRRRPRISTVASAVGLRNVRSATDPGSPLVWKIKVGTSTESLALGATRRPLCSWQASRTRDSSRRTIVRPPVQIASRGRADGTDQTPSAGA